MSGGQSINLMIVVLFSRSRIRKLMGIWVPQQAETLLVKGRGGYISHLQHSGRPQRKGRSWKETLCTHKVSRFQLTYERLASKHPLQHLCRAQLFQEAHSEAPSEAPPDRPAPHPSTLGSTFSAVSALLGGLGAGPGALFLGGGGGGQVERAEGLLSVFQGLCRRGGGGGALEQPSDQVKRHGGRQKQTSEPTTNRVAQAEGAKGKFDREGGLPTRNPQCLFEGEGGGEGGRGEGGWGCFWVVGWGEGCDRGWIGDVLGLGGGRPGFTGVGGWGPGAERQEWEGVGEGGVFVWGGVWVVGGVGSGGGG